MSSIISHIDRVHKFFYHLRIVNCFADTGWYLIHTSLSRNNNATDTTTEKIKIMNTIQQEELNIAEGLPPYASRQPMAFKYSKGGNPMAVKGENPNKRLHEQAVCEHFAVWGTKYICMEIYTDWNKKMQFRNMETGDTFYRTHNEITQGKGDPATGEITGQALERKLERETKLLPSKEAA